MAVVADLHVHTTVSDGTLELADLPAAARRGGVDVVAVTDHDRIHPGLHAPVSTTSDVTVVRGIELRVVADDQPVDLLGYAVDPTPALSSAIERLQRNRVERAAAIVACVEDRLGVDLDLDLHPGVGRPHIARTIEAHPDARYDFQGAFDALIGDDRPCYVAREIPEFSRGRRLLADACAFVGLAHPLRYDDPEAALALAADLDAVERWYPYDRPVGAGGPHGAGPGVDTVDRAIEKYDLLPTGGSDAHDDQLGGTGLDRAAYERVRERLPAAE